VSELPTATQLVELVQLMSLRNASVDPDGVGKPFAVNEVPSKCMTSIVGLVPVPANAPTTQHELAD